jgi:hypothetical protein
MAEQGERFKLYTEAEGWSLSVGGLTGGVIGISTLITAQEPHDHAQATVESLYTKLDAVNQAETIMKSPSAQTTNDFAKARNELHTRIAVADHKIPPTPSTSESLFDIFGYAAIGAAALTAVVHFSRRGWNQHMQKMHDREQKMLAYRHQKLTEVKIRLLTKQLDDTQKLHDFINQKP